MQQIPEVFICIDLLKVFDGLTQYHYYVMDCSLSEVHLFSLTFQKFSVPHILGIGCNCTDKHL
jgi:hypothetical protein